MTKEEFFDWVDIYFEHFTDEDKSNILMNCTAFPFAGNDFEMYKESLLKYHLASDGTPAGMMSLASKDMDIAFNEAEK
jgi:hypothetical protein